MTLLTSSLGPQRFTVLEYKDRTLWATWQPRRLSDASSGWDSSSQLPRRQWGCISRIPVILDSRTQKYWGRIEAAWTPKSSTPPITAIQDSFHLRKSWTCEHHLPWGLERVIPWNQGAMDLVFLSKPARRGSCSSLNQRTMTSLESGRRGRSQVLMGRKRVREGTNQRSERE